MCSFSMFLFASGFERKKAIRSDWLVCAECRQTATNPYKKVKCYGCRCQCLCSISVHTAHGTRTCYEIWYLHTFADFRLRLFLRLLFASNNKKGHAIKGHCLRRKIAAAHSVTLDWLRFPPRYNKLFNLCIGFIMTILNISMSTNFSKDAR